MLQTSVTVSAPNFIHNCAQGAVEEDASDSVSGMYEDTDSDEEPAPPQTKAKANTADKTKARKLYFKILIPPEGKMHEILLPSFQRAAPF